MADFESIGYSDQSFGGLVTSAPQSVQLPQGGNTNALSISLLSGPQTISVAARLGYNYETPLDGKIIIEPEL